MARLRRVPGLLPARLLPGEAGALPALPGGPQEVPQLQECRGAGLAPPGAGLEEVCLAGPAGGGVGALQRGAGRQPGQGGHRDGGQGAGRQVSSGSWPWP